MRPVGKPSATQIDFAARRNVPWGISEAAFSALDINQIYQYQAFGVPGLGMRRGLEDDLVVAPYASALALLIEPRAALRNLRRLTHLGLRGPYGYYDSIDYTRQRQVEGQHGLVAYTVHGAPSRHDPAGDRQHVARRRHARPGSTPISGYERPNQSCSSAFPCRRCLSKARRATSRRSS